MIYLQISHVKSQQVVFCDSISYFACCIQCYERCYEAFLYVLQIIGSGSPMELMSDCSYMCKHQNYDSRFRQLDEETTCGFFNLEVGKI